MILKINNLPIIHKISSDKKVIPVFLSISNEYFPFFSVLLVSLAKNIASDEYLDIVVFSNAVLHQENDECSKEILNIYKNFSLRFIDVSDLTNNWNPYIRGHVTKMTYFRFLAPYIMKDYDRAIYLDGDTLVVDDIGKLYDISLGNYMLAAVKDPAAAGIYNKGDTNVVHLIDNIIKLKNPYDYFQAGVLVVNLISFREQYTLQFLMNLCEKKCWRYVDQDVLNYLCKGKVMFLDNAWNVETRSALKIPLQFAPDDIRKLYNTARLKPSVIHYAGVEKPWNIPNSDFAELYNIYARESSLYSKKYLNKSKNFLNTSFSELSSLCNVAGVFFRCATPFHLFNAINIKVSSYSHCNGYLVLTNDVDWKDIPENLRKAQIFDEVVVSQSDRDVSAYNRLTESEKIHVADRPSVLLMQNGFDSEMNVIKRHKNITDLFFALNSKTEWIFYYACCEILNNAPRVHLFEDGTMSYVFNYIDFIQQNDFVPKLTHRSSYVDSLVELLVYAPEISSVKKMQDKLVRLSPISNNTNLRNMLVSVFGSPNLPEEEFIYFDSPCFENKTDYNSMDVLDQIANVVGKENIIIKLHPRTKVNRYSLRGYKVMSADNSLWEINCLDHRFVDKVYISMLSTAVLNCYNIFGMVCNSINIHKLNPLCKDMFLMQNGANKILNKMYEVNNSLTKAFRQPKNFDEMKEILLYLKGANISK